MKGYAFLTAEALNADAMLTCFSGHGIISGYTGDPSVRNDADLVPPYYEKEGRCGSRLPDGRLAEVSLANALSPEQGLDKIGPTAVVNSVLKTDLKVATNGMVLDLKFSPSFLESDRHMDALRDLVNAYFKNGGMEVQFNVVSRATLVAAQQHPEQHQDLVVRVSGFSAYFTTLMKTTQDEIIARTEYANM